jgi:hypothetical protein
MYDINNDHIKHLNLHNGVGVTLTSCYFLDQLVQLQRYQDESSNTFYYKSLSQDTWSSGNTQCQALGGHLPIIRSAGKQSFLAAAFPGQFWIGLSSDSSR